MKNTVVFLLMISGIVYAQQPRVFVHGSHGYKYVAGVDHPLPRLDGYGHDQTMELAKTFLQRCPNVTPNISRDNADFDVQLNWTPRTRLFFLGKIIHKPDQILVANRNGDVLYSGVARSVGGDVEGACRALTNAERTVAQARGSNFVGNDTYAIPSGLTLTTPVSATMLKNVSDAQRQPPSVPVSAHESTNLTNGTIPIPALGLMVTTRNEGGAQIVALANGGVAESAYMHVGDVINTFDGKPVKTPLDLAALCGTISRGTQVRVGYLYHTSALGDIEKEAVITAQ